MRWWLGALALLVAAAPTAAQGVHLLVVTGLSGEPRFARAFAEQASALLDAAATRWGVPDSSLIYLAEEQATGGGRSHGRATREGIQAALVRLGSRVKPDDVVLIVLFGHGSQQGDEARLSLPGPDLTAGDLAAAVSGFTQQTVVVVNAASASGEFLAPLSGRRRVIVTATRSGFERNAPLFGEQFVRGLAQGEADTDKDGRVSIAEAFVFARGEVARRYEAERRLLTEHAQLDDNGDKVGSQDLAGAADGALARAVTFTLQPEAALSDPRAPALLAERRRLETQIAELRQRKPTLDSLAYERELERLLLQLAETTQALRALERKP